MRLKYGESAIHFNTNRELEIFRIKEPVNTIDSELFKRRLLDALWRLQPDVSNPLIVVGDKTRLCGYPTYLPVVLHVLREYGATVEQVKILIAYGTHLPQSDQESCEAYGAVFKEHTFTHHDCNAADCFENLGTTSRGTPVFLRNDVLEASFLLTFGAISHHYFAGYGGGRKLIFPGLGYKPSIYRNHGLFLDTEAQHLAKGCKAGVIDGNPLAEDLAEVERFRPADMAIHGILNSRGDVCDLLVGSGNDFFRNACAFYGTHCENGTERRFDLVMASCGGFPKDINFIQSHKAIHNAAFFVKDGGHLIVLAECRDGIGSNTFLPWFEPKDYVLTFEKLSRQYEGNGGTALAMMEKLKRIRISLVTTIDSKTADLVGFETISPDQAQAILNAAMSPTAVIPNASLLVKTAHMI